MGAGGTTGGGSGGGGGGGSGPLGGGSGGNWEGDDHNRKHDPASAMEEIRLLMLRGLLLVLAGESAASQYFRRILMALVLAASRWGGAVTRRPPAWGCMRDAMSNLISTGLDLGLARPKHTDLVNHCPVPKLSLKEAAEADDVSFVCPAPFHWVDQGLELSLPTAQTEQVIPWPVAPTSLEFNSLLTHQ